MIFRVNDVKKTIPETVRIVAATKYFTVAEMRQLFEEGIHDFGENRDDSLLMKVQELSDLPITWHYIGTMQTKKVKKVIEHIEFLHSLDRFKLAEEINKRRTKPLKCFIQINISDENSKHGLNPDQVLDFLRAISDFEKIDVIGFMGMASFTSDMDTIGRQFQVLQDLQNEVYQVLNMNLKELSIGMSNDYPVALEHNATFLRLGSVLFKKEVA